MSIPILKTVSDAAKLDLDVPEYNIDPGYPDPPAEGDTEKQVTAKIAGFDKKRALKDEIHAAVEARYAKERGSATDPANVVRRELHGLTAKQIAKKFKLAETKDFAKELSLKVSGKEIEVAERIVEHLSK